MNELKAAVVALNSGDLRTAERHCRTLLATSPKNPDALNLLGIVAGRAGKHDVAADLMQRSVSIAPAKAGYRGNLATALLSLDRAEEAEMSLKEGLVHCPNDAKLQALLATSFGKQGKTEAAINAMNQAVKLGANDAFTHFNLAELYRRDGQQDEAIRHFARAIEIEPRYVDALNNLAGIHLDRGDYVDAMRLIQKSLNINQRSSQAYTNLGIVMFAAGETEQSLVAVRNALKVDPKSERARFQLANMLLGTGVIEEAEGILQSLREEFPDDQVYTAMVAKTKERKGDISAALEIIETIDDEESLQNPTVAISKAVILGSHGDRQGAINVLETIVAENESAAIDGIGIHFTLAEQLDRDGQYDAAFEHFEIGNENRRKAFFDSKDEPRETSIVDRLIREIDADSYREAQSSQSPEAPIFIVGMPRSGTSLTEQILASHSKVFGGGELRFLQHEITRSHGVDTVKPKRGPFEIVDIDGTREQSGFVPRDWPHTDIATLDNIANLYMSRVRQLSDGSACNFTDKMPYNFFVVPLIAKLFPNAKIIHTRRHPLDTCLSCYFQNFTGGNQYAYRLDDLGSFYREYLRWMSHCRDVLQVEMLEIDYERVVQDPQDHVAKILEYCGLEWEDDCLEFHKSKRIVRTASYHQVRNPIYKRSVNRWRNYEKHIAPLVTSLGVDFELLKDISPKL